MSKWIKSSEFVEFFVSDRVATVRLNRPERRNALSYELLTEYRNALLEADDLRSVSAIVVEGAGKDFCAGYDMKASYARYAADAEGETPYRTGNASMDDDCWKLERTQELLRTPFDIHKPVIAKVRGNCVAGGTDLALYCDMIIAAEDARIGFPATRAMGSPPNHMWIYNVGPQWAKRLLLSGDTLDGRTAARLGLVMDCAPADQLDGEVARLAGAIGSIDPELLATNKRIVNLALEIGGAGVMQRLAAEMDARAHLTRAKRDFDDDVKRLGLKEAFARRDEPFGDSTVRINW
ncbi:MAG: crotonase/enoyl-CoA hydratase family protein [Rhodobiaceae bacterium]|nr:crotonase/enoyl-CoA hydratase family protein [Rhodobiaceae bacterium]MCC0056195.1 crotonase/enoyl-CoA hydratase family protein [Rhodobiaceae bacterium]